MGCGGSDQDNDEIEMEHPSAPVDNTPYDKMESVADAKAWAKFASFHHKPLRGEGDYNEDGRGLKELEEVTTFKNGDLYLGSVNEKSNKPDGFGVLCQNKKAGGGIHQGYFLDGVATGEGIAFAGTGKNAGQVTIGNFKKGKAHGEAQIEYTDGHKYHGELKNEARSGHGIEIWPSGERFEGTYKADQRDGWGVHKKKDGSVYEGSYKAGKRDGPAKLVDAKGVVSYKIFAKDAPTKKAATEEDFEKARPNAE